MDLLLPLCVCRGGGSGLSVVRADETGAFATLMSSFSGISTRISSVFNNPYCALFQQYIQTCAQEPIPMLESLWVFVLVSCNKRKADGAFFANCGCWLAALLGTQKRFFHKWIA